MRGPRTYRRVLCVLLGTGAIGIGAAAPADAVIGSMSASLAMSRNGQFLENVNVSGNVAMTQAEAQNLINSHYRLVSRLWGDDPISDDFLFGPNEITGLSATPQGLHFEDLPLQINRRFLNEDTSFFDNHDEVYAGVRLLTPAGATLRSRETNRVGGYF